MHEKECVICKVKFTTNKKMQLCCSEKCSKKRKYIKIAEYREKMKIKQLENQNENKKISREDNLNIAAKESFNLNISYGMYIALKDGYL